MAPNPLSPSFAIPPLLIFIFFSPSLAQLGPSSTPLTPDTVCNPTLYPSFCKSMFPNNKSQNVYDYSCFSVSQSLQSARTFSVLIDKYLSNPSSLSSSAIMVLQDCKLLAGLNVDFLSSTSTTLNSTKSLSSLKTEELHTLLSAMLTNQQTCLYGLQVAASALNVRNGLSTLLSNGTKFYSVSLSLFTRGWVRDRKKSHSGSGRKLLFSDMDTGLNGWLPLRMSSHNREIIESVSNRKLLLTSPAGVLVRAVVVVNPNGKGNFTTIKAAVAAAPNNSNINDGYFLIYVVAGVYKEYINIDKNKKNVMMVGDGINKTVITGSRSVGDGSTTFNSATFIVVGERFVAVNITFQNTAGPSKGQAVALRSGSDLSAFYRCSFDAYQDTLYTHSLRQFYRECDIYGTVDFIFGDAAVVFQTCNIYPRLPKHGQFNTITAQGRSDPNQNTGTSIHNCTITATPDLAAANGTVKTVLGRPWQQYARTVYMQSFMDSLIDPSGWDPWDGGSKLKTLYYAEYKNRGPGSSTTKRVSWPGYHSNISSTDAENFTVTKFLSGTSWLPATGVTFISGLL